MPASRLNDMYLCIVQRSIVLNYPMLASDIILINSHCLLPVSYSIIFDLKYLLSFTLLEVAAFRFQLNSVKLHIATVPTQLPATRLLEYKYSCRDIIFRSSVLDSYLILNIGPGVQGRHVNAVDAE